MGIQDLPKPGINFKATIGPGSFQRKLSGATRYGSLRNLRDNQKAIIDRIKNPTVQRAIRRGGLSRLQQRDAWLKIRAKDKTINKEDRREIKEVLKHLGRGSLATQNKTAVGLKQRLSPKDGKIIKIKGKVVFISNKQIKANLKNRKQIDDSFLTGGDSGQKTKPFAGAVGKTYSSGVKGIAQDLGIKKATVGFAANYNKKLPDSSVSRPSLGGVKPLGL
jgi:hypothetical protein